MVQINFAQKTVNVKIVYYGPGMSGKTTNLEVVHQRAPSSNRGELTSISTDGDRTLFFDYMPLDLGMVAGMRCCFQVYTVPGQVYYNSTRKLVLQGVDGVIFVADSSASMLDQNLESLRNLEENLNEYGKSLSSLPHVMQWNKRDLPDAMQAEELERHLNHHQVASFDAIANTGQGVFPTLKALAAFVLKNIMKETGGPKSEAARPAAAPAPPPPAEAPVATAPVLDTPPPQPPVSAPTPTAQPAAPPPAQAMPAAATHVTSPHEEFQDLTVLSEAAPAAGAAPLDIVQQQVAPPPEPAVQSTPASVMQQPSAAPTAPSRPDPRAHAVPKPGAAARRARPAKRTAPVTPPPKRNANFATGAFVALAAGAGAAIAWIVLTVL